MKILFVCSGNTCRSPMASAILQQFADRDDLASAISVSSAGVAAQIGSPASTVARDVMVRMGLSLAYHEARQIGFADLVENDLVLTMTEGQRHILASGMPEVSDKVFSLGTFIGEKGDVVDPYGGGAQEYEACAVVLTNWLAAAWEKIKTQLALQTGGASNE